MVRKYKGGALNLLTVNSDDYANFYPEPPPVPPRNKPPPVPPRSKPKHQYSSVQDELLSKIKRQQAINTDGIEQELSRIRRQKQEYLRQHENPFNISARERAMKPSIDQAFNIANELRQRFGDRSNTQSISTVEKPRVGKLNIPSELRQALASIYGHGMKNKKRRTNVKCPPKGSVEAKRYMAYVRSFRRRRR